MSEPVISPPAGAGDTPPIGITIPGIAPGPLTPVPSADPWSDYLTKHPEPTKLEPYKGAKSAVEAFELSQARLAEAQTALRTRQPGLPPRPGADAPPEALTAWRQAHGIPETPEGYGLTRPESVPEEAWNAEEAMEFQKWAHEEGLTPDLVKKLQQFDLQRQQTGLTKAQQQQAAGVEALRISEAQELGKRYGDKLDATLSDVQAVTQAMGKDPSVFDPHSDKFWGVEALQFATDLMKRIPRGEDGTVRSVGAPSSNGAYDKAWAKASLSVGHPDYAARTNAGHPQHAEMSKRANEAYALG